MGGEITRHYANHTSLFLVQILHWRKKIFEQPKALVGKNDTNDLQLKMYWYFIYLFLIFLDFYLSDVMYFLWLVVKRIMIWYTTGIPLA